MFCVTYRINAFSERNCRWNPLCVTLNPVVKPGKKHRANQWEYQRPLLNVKALDARSELTQIQNTDERHLMFCGSWTGYGLQEDGVRSAFALTTEHLGAKLPFKFVDSFLYYEPVRPLNPWDYLIRSILCIIEVLFWIYGIMAFCVIACRRAVTQGPRMVSTQFHRIINRPGAAE